MKRLLLQKTRSPGLGYSSILDQHSPFPHPELFPAFLTLLPLLPKAVSDTSVGLPAWCGFTHTSLPASPTAPPSSPLVEGSWRMARIAHGLAQLLVPKRLSMRAE